MHHIKFAGLASEWTADYAKAYSDTLHEMGFNAKALSFNDLFIVAYAHRPFTKVEVDAALDALLTQNNEGEGISAEE